MKIQTIINKMNKEFVFIVFLGIIINSVFNCNNSTTTPKSIEEYISPNWEVCAELSGGFIYCIAENQGGDLFCGGQRNIYKSTNHGTEWELSGIFDGSVYDILCVNSSQIFAVAGKKIYKSNDNGNSWEQWYILEGDNVWIECIELFSSSKILVATGGLGMLQIDIATKIVEKLQTESIYFNNIYIDPKEENIIYGCNAAGAELSIDGGITWIKTTFPSDIYTMVNCMVRVNDTLLLAGSGYNDFGKSTLMFQSKDNGLNWDTKEITGEDLGGGIYSLAIMQSGRILAGFALTHGCDENSGIFYSDDIGKTWTKALNNPVSVLNFHLSQNNKIYASTFDGILYSDDGLFWSDMNDGIYNLNVSDIVITDLNEKFLATSKGLLLYDKNKKISEIKLPDIFNSTPIKKLYNCGNDIVIGSANHKIGRYMNNSWDVISYIPFWSETYSICGDKSGNVFCGTNSGVFRSDNYGAEWTPTTLFNSNYLYAKSVLFTSDERLFASVVDSDNNGLFKSDDLGETWTKIEYFKSDIIITSMASYKDELIIVGTQENGIFISTNNGKKWTKSGLEGIPVNSICCYNNLLIIVATDDGVFMTNDGGDSWNIESSGLFDLDINVVRIGNNNHLYVGGKGLGISIDPIK